MHKWAKMAGNGPARACFGSRNGPFAYMAVCWAFFSSVSILSAQSDPVLVEVSVLLPASHPSNRCNTNKKNQLVHGGRGVGGVKGSSFGWKTWSGAHSSRNASLLRSRKHWQRWGAPPTPPIFISQILCGRGWQRGILG